ncbi:hypothetical protein, variant [Salpingoeca rosetta]|nr:hypothetical protein, variant [Salpingoeca rosetta]EGD78667.1 hypothetical protein, variant [Salpingoeca rosetta]|eukprot:XP_012493082.1 hypothetical protein, variant [Salpingoeca rosetta]
MMDEPCASVSVLFVISAKKQRHIDLQRVIKTARKYGMICDVAEVDALEAVRENTYDVIVHKVTEFAALSRQGDKKAARIIDAFKAFIASQPSSCVVVDPLARSEVLLDRELTFTKLRQCTTTHGTWRITTPTSAVIRSQDDLANLEARLSEAGVEVPVICKSVTAHGSKAAHEMCLLLSTQASPSIAPPFIAQTFVPHNAVLIKVFVVGDSFTVCHRPSIRNLQHNSATHAPLCIPFDSHDVSKPHSESHLNV